MMDSLDVTAKRDKKERKVLEEQEVLQEIL